MLLNHTQALTLLWKTPVVPPPTSSDAPGMPGEALACLADNGFSPFISSLLQNFPLKRNVWLKRREPRAQKVLGSYGVLPAQHGVCKGTPAWSRPQAQVLKIQVSPEKKQTCPKGWKC